MASRRSLSMASLLGLAVVLMGIIAQVSLADVKQKTYLIKGRKVESVISAANQLRNFLSVGLTAQQRCQRHAILLNAYQLKKSTLTNFQIAEIALAKREEIEKQFNAFSIETLRNLYIEGIQSFLDAGAVDGALVELYKCLSTNFRNRDIKARSFLNNEEIKRIIDQYDSITKQPVRVLIEDSVKHPELKLDDLHPNVRAEVSRWFQGDELELDSLFGGRNVGRHYQQAERSYEPTPVKPLITEAHAAASSYVDSESVPHAQAQAHASVGQHQQVATPALESSIGAETQVAPAEATAGEQEDEDAIYLGYVFGAIIATYESLPLETSLSERCRAYSQVCETEKEDLLKEGFVGELVQTAASRQAAAAAAAAAAKPQLESDAFVPDQSKRENFLFVLQTVDPLQGGAEAWTDMVDCVKQWEAIDKEAATFMNSPELAKTFEQILAQSSGETAGAESATATDPLPRQNPEPQPIEHSDVTML